MEQCHDGADHSPPRFVPPRTQPHLSGAIRPGAIIAFARRNPPPAEMKMAVNSRSRAEDEGQQATARIVVLNSPERVPAQPFVYRARRVSKPPVTRDESDE